ncbi:FxsB family cyclophane-forming radical SAM/SPASM peptide maturase [Streptacidiphilus melanogenes]|uniref:FxsB family cyclophane-forming radical SAM/SPASM peptide maturase n=1 Tax=Streptacidiphilus melanogenes TaxID=411235 RepID=UPI0005A60198|nr:FxsB family cyclophane-forming radical SAM/SPASM peptide maturase [Streptacidiphilus melanogenes]
MNTDDTDASFSQFVLKMHSRCDLACDHCYVYEHADTSWERRPMTPSDEVLRATAQRIAEHARRHRLATVHVVLHGGEPLLAGHERLAFAAEQLTAALAGVCRLDLRIHTNGVTLGERHLELFDRYDVKVGISLDGDRAANDLHRRYRNGRSSHDKVVRAVRRLNTPRYRHLYAGLLCTIDVRNDPTAVYEALLELDPPRIDFLLPHATWAEPPLRPPGAGPTPYAEWLMTILTRWDAQGRPVPVRFFDSVLRTLAGEDSLTESLGLAPADLLVIETDGTLEQADSLKTAYDGAPETGFDVLRDPVDAAARHPALLGRQLGLAGLCTQCRTCPVVDSCGGGLYAHRYRAEPDPSRAFDHPSVYCEDLYAFITRTKEQLGVADQHDAAQALLPPSLFDELGTGHGGAEAVSALRDAQVQLGREFLDELAARAEQLAPGEGGSRGLWPLFARLDAEAPAALDAVLSHPYLRPWALSALTADSPTGAEEILGGLAESAAAALVLAGLEARVAVPLREGSLLLPTVGRLDLTDCGSTPGATVTVSTDPDGFTVEVGADGGSVRVPRARAEQPAEWQPLRVRPAEWQPLRVWAEAGWSVALEDLDPRRSRHNWAPTGRLTEAEAALWRERLTGAWAWIRDRLPQYADGLRVGLGTVTPLCPGEAGIAVSGAARDAFGNVGVALPDSDEYLALLLVHEFQHVKLGAVFDVDDLFDRRDTRTYRAPWRPDPRPFEGLFQGTYAHIAVVEYWRARASELAGTGAEDVARAARGEYERWLRHTFDAVLTLAGSGSLTAQGERFVAAMRATLAPLMSELDAGTELVEAGAAASSVRG